nr:aldo/keto reductase [Maliibacterium massiliense]
MQTRIFATTNAEISLFGLGCMRLPSQMVDGKSVVDRSESIRMIRAAIDAGVNYIDTAYPYHNGESELIVGMALQDGYRQRTNLATKLPVWEVNCHADCMRILDEQLEKLQTDHIDYYLLHSVDGANWARVEKYDILRFLDEAKAAGKILHAGFSFHDHYELFDEAIHAYPWDMAQIQLNFLDEHYQAGVRGVELARSMGIPIVIMEPLKGGMLAQTPPEAVQRLWASAPQARTPVEWGFHYVGNIPGVNVILSGCSSMAQLQDNIRIFQHMPENHLTAQELALIAKVRKIYNSTVPVQCTKCRYCMPCPRGVDIPLIFELYNDIALSGNMRKGVGNYGRVLEAGRGQDRCVACGACQQHCPQSLPIIEKLKEAHAFLWPNP